MPHILAELTPFDPVSATRPTVRASSAQDRRITGLNDQKWRPAIVVKPTLTMKLFDGDFSTDVEPGEAAFTLQLDQIARVATDVNRYRWAGAKVTLYAGEAITAWPWETVFKGVVTGFEAEAGRLKLRARVDTEPFEADVLTAKYAGSGGAEGGADLKNKPKPWLAGRCKTVEPVLIDAVNNVYQFHGYGPIQAVNALYERADDSTAQGSWGASAGDYANYAALVAATIPNGRWGTCLAEGMVRLGAPPYGVVTGDVDGDKPAGTWLRKTGEILNRLSTNAGVSAGLIDSASLTALDTALAGLSNQGRIGVYLTEQAKLIDVARRLARPCNAQAGISWAGKLFVVRVTIGTPALVLDAQGTRNPLVTDSVELDVSPPYWRMEMGADRCWRVHSLAEISTYVELIDRGDYSASGWYREGNLAKDQDVRWKYINATPGSGNAPPTLPTAANSHWELVDEKLGPIEPNADVTSAVTSESGGIITVEYDYLGAPLTGELPRNDQFRLLRNGVDVTLDAAWSLSVLSGTYTGSIDADTGILNTDTGELGTAEAVVRITAAYLATERSFDVKFVKHLGEAPGSGGGGGGGPGSDSTTSFGFINSTTFTTIATLEIEAASATPALSASLTCRPALSPDPAGDDESWNVEGKWVRENGVTDVDVGSTANSDPDPRVYRVEEMNFRDNGSLGVAAGDSGLTPGNTYTYYLQAKLTSGTRTITFTGTASVTS